MSHKQTKHHTPSAVVVNDDKVQLQVLSELLREAGIEAHPFTNVPDTLAWIKTGERPDLVVTDLHMPGIDGWRFCWLLRSPEYQAFNKVPILVVSATFAGEAPERIAADLGAEAFLPAPVDGQKFMELAMSLLRGERQRARLQALIVEDSAPTAAMLYKAFSAKGWQTDRVESLKEANDAIASRDYAVAVLDYFLPDGRGDDLLEVIQDRQSDCVCLMMTSDPGQELAIEWLNRGASAYLRKPFDPAYLVEMCSRARKERALLRAEDLLEIRTQELIESENRYRTVVENTRDIAWKVSADGVFTFVSSALRFTGYEVDEIEGRSIEDLFPFAARKIYKEFLDRLRNDPSEKTATTLVLPHYDKDGRRWIGEIVATPVRDPEGRLVEVVGVTRDITERKRAEDALHMQSLVLDQIQDHVTVTDLSGVITYVNRAQSDTMGMPRQDIIGKMTSVYGEDPERGATRRVIVEKTLGNGHWRGEIVNFAADGSERIMDCRTQVIHDENGAPVALCGIATNITDRKEAENALSESEARNKALLNAMPDMMFLLSSDGVFLDFHTGDSSSLLVSPELFLGKHVMEVLPQPVADLTLSNIRKVLETRDQALYVYNVSIRGTVKFFEARMVLCTENSAMAIVRDITEQKKTEDALIKSEERFRMIAENTSDGILVFENGEITYVSPAYEYILGYNASDELGRTAGDILAIVHPDDVKSVWETIDNAINSHTENNDLIYTFRAKSKSGDWVWREDHTQLLYDSDGVYRSSIVVSRDITERKRAEAEKAELEARLQQAQKLESVGRLAGGVAHDFNNMLNVILGHAEYALEFLTPENPLHASLVEINKAAERSADLTKQLLAFARRQTVTPKVLDLNDTLSGMLKMLHRLIGEDIELDWMPGHNLWPVRMDTSQVDQILANLCVNARDAIRGVGKVTIKTANATLAHVHDMHYPGAMPGEYVTVSVSDNGCGMDSSTLDHIFEPFFTTKGVGKGTGLGLATVYGIVSQNHGFLDVSSQPDEGTTFTIYLPRHIGKSEQTGKDAQPEPVARGHETILLVEDEHAILDMAARMLERAGYTVLTAATPGMAVRCATEYNGEIHLLITDVIMPEMNGRTLAKRLLSLYPGIRRLFMSGYTADVIADHGVLDEGVNFIQKPFSRKELAAKIREVLDGV